MKCTNCNGTLYYNVDKKVLMCRHCGSTFDPQSFVRDMDASEFNWEGTILYTCRNCGAQLVSLDDTAVTYCSYCGSETILKGQITGDRQPRMMIPFKVSKTKCKAIYKKELAKKLYVPDEFKDPEFIDKFRGVYIPYWMYYVKFRDNPIGLKGTKTYTRGNYDYYEEYEVVAKIHDNGLYGIPYDGSRNFDDSIAEEIAPFRRKDMIPFNPAYLAGMYADRANVEPHVYEEEVKERATEEAIRDIGQDFPGINLKFPGSIKEKEEFLQTTYQGHDTVYLPVWFLTWKKDDRVAYAVVNGQTGKIHMEMPVDKRKFIRTSLLIALAIFAVLTLFLTVTARFLTWVSALLVLLIGYGFHAEMKKIRDKENHVFDKGYLITEEGERLMSEKTAEKLRKRKENSLFGDKLNAWGIVKIVFISLAVLTGLPIAIVFFSMFSSGSGASVLVFCILILQVFLTIREFVLIRHLKDKSSALTSLIALLAVACNYLISMYQPVEDWWYYLGTMVCLIASAVMSIDLIDRYNELSTRPLPSFYERKGGDDNA